MGMDRRPLGGWGEFAFVIAGAFGYFIISSIYIALHLTRLSGPSSGHSTGSFWTMAVLEIVVLVVLGSLLHSRGWTARSLGLTLRWSDIPVGIGLMLICWTIVGVAEMILRFAFPSVAAAAANVHVIQSSITIPSAIAVVLVNPFYEEVFVAGYVIAALKGERSANMAVNISVAIRLLYHLYQGIAGVLMIVPLGLIFAIWFAQTKRLWPLIVAHALFDAIGIFTVILH